MNLGSLRGRAAGWLMAAMILLLPAHALGWVATAPASLGGWLAALLLWPDLRRSQKRQVAILAGLGVAGLVFALARGGDVPWDRVIAQNHLILAMLAAVSFLRLVAMPALAPGDSERLPQGFGAMLRTLAGTHLFGAVINLSAVVVIGDRLSRAGAMDARAALLISRGFTSAVYYSPFFGGTALALTLAEGARLAVVVAVGLPLALVGLGYAAWDARRRDPERLRGFRGFPTDLRSLAVPLMLAVGVLGTHLAWPSVSVLVVIAWLAPLLVALLLWWRGGRREATRSLLGHVQRRLPEMRGELALFLAAGVLASGLTATFGAFGGWLPVERLDGTSATVIMLLTVLAGTVGLHPVIALTTAASVLAPTAPSPDLLAVMFVLSWGLGTAVSPMAVTHLTMQGRYGIDAWMFPRSNVGYGLLMMVLGSVALHLLDAALSAAPG